MLLRCVLFFIFLIGGLKYGMTQNTVNGTLSFGGIERSYSFYVPASYTPGTPAPLVINLHGLGTDGAYQAQYRDFRPIADTAGFIVVHPDGSTLFGQRFWNYGNVLGSTVDDVGFLESLIDVIASQYTVNQERVYCVGMSNGSFMSYYLACQSNRFAAIGAVTGSMSVTMYNDCVPQYPMPVIHIHGTEDGVNPYGGNSTMKGIEEVVLFWANQNSCHLTPEVTSVPDNNINDNATAQRVVYSGGINGHTVELFKVIGGGHTWPGTVVPGSTGNVCLDFKAEVEIWRFFNQYQRAEQASIPEFKESNVTVWPNPTSLETIYLKAEGNPIHTIAITDQSGREVVRQTGDDIQSVRVSKLSPGSYLLKGAGKQYSFSEKLIIVKQ